LGFIASARIGLPEAVLNEHGYVKVVAKQIKGFPREIVIVDQDEYEGLNAETKSAYFETV
jgi:hypothetical protein